MSTDDESSTPTTSSTLDADEQRATRGDDPARRAGTPRGDSAEVVATACFLFAALAAVGLAVVYWQGGQTQLEGILLAVATGGIGTGIVVWAKRYMPDEEAIEERESIESSEEDIAAAVSYGVVKMNVDTDTQYAYTRPVADHMFHNYSGVLKVDGEVGDKKTYDPRAWGKAAEAGMATRVGEACANLSSAGKTIG